MAQINPFILSHWKGHTPKELSRLLAAKVRRPTEDISKASIVINWGVSSRPSSYLECPIINSFEGIRLASSKLYSLRQFRDNKVPCPEFTENKDEAKDWLFGHKSILLRHKLTGKGGEGAQVVKAAEFNGEPIPDARLYVKYFPKDLEARIHVFDKKVILYAEKRRKRGLMLKPDYWIRSHHNGWVFCTEGITWHKAAETAAVAAVEALGLDFGAADIGISPKGNVCVFEVNSAPGLMGKTLDKYVEIFKHRITSNV